VRRARRALTDHPDHAGNCSSTTVLFPSALLAGHGRHWLEQRGCQLSAGMMQAVALADILKGSGQSAHACMDCPSRHRISRVSCHRKGPPGMWGIGSRVPTGIDPDQHNEEQERTGIDHGRCRISLMRAILRPPIARPVTTALIGLALVVAGVVRRYAASTPWPGEIPLREPTHRMAFYTTTNPLHRGLPHTSTTMNVRGHTPDQSDHSQSPLLPHQNSKAYSSKSAMGPKRSSPPIHASRFTLREELDRQDSTTAVPPLHHRHPPPQRKSSHSSRSLRGRRSEPIPHPMSRRTHPTTLPMGHRQSDSPSLHWPGIWLSHAAMMYKSLCVHSLCIRVTQ
jgi:hypothetical protein